MNQELQESGTYDRVFAEGGWQGVYRLHYRRSPYYPMYRATLAAIQKIKAQSILEVGCGPGHFAQMVQETTMTMYQGFDFSPVAITQAINRTGRADLFRVADALNPASYHGQFDTIVCTEVLEHIRDDMGVVSLWPKGTLCICSVPNYDSKTHVRFFRDEKEILKRYGELIEINSICRVRTPQAPKLALGARLRYAVQNYRRPRRFFAALGIHTFQQRVWFVITGRRR